MINSNDPSPHNYADAIQSVRETGAADFTMPGGTILKLDKNKLLQNYEAILFCAGIEQMLGEAVGFAPGQEQFKPAGSALSRYAETPEEWMPPLGLLLGRARKAKGFKKRLMDEIGHFKLARDKVLHGETPSFGLRTRKRSRGIFHELAAHSRLTPRVKLVERLAQVDAAKKALPDATSDEMLSTLRLLYLSIEAESDIRRALMPHQVRNLQAVESVFELLRIEDAHKCCFKREGVVQCAHPQPHRARHDHHANDTTGADYHRGPQFRRPSPCGSKLSEVWRQSLRRRLQQQPRLLNTPPTYPKLSSLHEIHHQHPTVD